MSHILYILHVFQVCFKDFANKISDARRSADSGHIDKIEADTEKLIGNSAYGSMLLNVNKHKTISYQTSSRALTREINKKTFHHLSVIGDDMFEVYNNKSRVVHKMPVHLGFFILQYAKLRMISFYYDFLDVFVGRKSFSYLQMDTDSAYISIAGKFLEEVIKPEYTATYKQMMSKSCDDKIIYEPTLNNPHFWLPRSCCRVHAMYDARTPGLFKLEFSGDAMICLSSKTYCVKGQDNLKFSCKGISKRQLNRDKLFELYYNVLSTGVSQSSTNIGFRLINGHMKTYKQVRCGFTYEYWKRVVLEDGVTTAPLDIWL